ncbi:MAG: serine hydrolase domain-containing protein [Candidatus Sericytochromatia bacterium]
MSKPFSAIPALKLLCLLVLLTPAACKSNSSKSDSTSTNNTTSTRTSAEPTARAVKSADTSGEAVAATAEIDRLSPSPDAYLRKLADKGKFNGVALLAKNHKIVFEKAYGFQDIASKKPMSTASCFNLASLSKPLTATAILMLYDAGKLKLDDPISKYLPDLGYDGVTIRHLLTHTSGLPDYIELAQEHWDTKASKGNADVVKLLSKYGDELAFKPGSKYEYSNSGYALLAAIAEKASGQKLPDFLAAKVFKPLGMNSSFVLTPTTTRRKDACRVYAYTRKGKSMVADKITSLDGVYGDGGVYASAEDLFRFDQALYTGKLLKPATLKQAFTSYKIKGKATDYGFGWDIAEGSVSHTGSWDGFQNNFNRYIDDGDTSILLTSVDNENNDAILEKIEASLSEE